MPTQVLGAGNKTLGNAIYRGAKTLAPAVPFLDPQAMEAASAKGDTGAVAAEATVPIAAALAPEATQQAGKGISAVAPSVPGAASRFLRDPATGKITITPSSIAERVIPQRPEVIEQAAKDARDAEMEAKAQALMQRGKEQAQLDAAHEKDYPKLRMRDKKNLAIPRNLKINMHKPSLSAEKIKPN